MIDTDLYAILAAVALNELDELKELDLRSAKLIKELQDSRNFIFVGLVGKSEDASITFDFLNFLENIKSTKLNGVNETIVENLAIASEDIVKLDFIVDI